MELTTKNISQIIEDFEIEFSGETYDDTKKQSLRELLDEWLPNELDKIYGNDFQTTED